MDIFEFILKIERRIVADFVLGKESSSSKKVKTQILFSIEIKLK